MLTRSGWAVIALSVVAGVAAVMWSSVDLATVAIAAASTLLPGLVWRVRPLVAYQVELAALTSTVHRGEDLRLAVRVWRAGRSTLPALRLALHACGAGVERVVRGRKAVWVVRAVRRGPQPVQFASLRCQDPLGMWWRRAKASVRQTGAGIISVRPRFIGLQSTVHTGSLTVLLDVHRHPRDSGDGDGDDPFELAVDVAFSLARSADAAGVRVGLLTNAPHHPAGYDGVETVTEVLTQVRACAEYPGCAAARSLRALVERHCQAAPPGPAVVVCTAPDAPAILAPLFAALPDQVRDLVIARVVRVAAASAATHPSGMRVLEVASLADAAAIWDYFGPRQSSTSTETSGSVTVAPIDFQVHG